MDDKQDSFYNYLKKSIIEKNKYNINSIQEIKNIKVANFNDNEFEEIKKFIFEKDINAITSFQFQNNSNHEYLSLYIFKDQNSRQYIAAFYDNDLPWQDLSLLDIYQL